MPTKAQSKWRAAATPIIAKVLKDTQGLPEKDIKKALQDAYPFGQREYHPYQIWLSEIKIQRGLVKPKPSQETTLNLF
jgi:hypothetical protein